MNFKNFSNLVFSSVTWLGTPIFYAPLIAYLWTAASPVALQLLVILVLTEIVCAVIKLAYYKERPVKLPDKNIFQKYDASSFPSVHSARAMAVLVMLSAAYAAYENALLIVLGLLLTMGVGYSRIYLKKHDVSDVIGGFVIGILMSTIFMLVKLA